MNRKRIVRKWTDEELKNAVKNNFNLTGTLRSLGLKVTGGNHESIRYWINELGIDTSHWRKDSKLRGLEAYRKSRELKFEDVFCENSTVSKNTVRRRYKEISVYRCGECGNEGQHNGKDLVLQLDHINGSNIDNRLENLRWLCPNCHSQTDTFCARNTKGDSWKIKNTCLDCGVNISGKADRCRKCANIFIQRDRKVEWPLKDELQKMIDTMPWLAIGRKYGVSDNAVRKWARKYGLI